MRPPGGACSRYAALRHEVARAAAILPRNQLHVRGGRAAPQQDHCDGRHRRKERTLAARARPTRPQGAPRARERNGPLSDPGSSQRGGSIEVQASRAGCSASSMRPPWIARRAWSARWPRGGTASRPTRSAPRVPQTRPAAGPALILGNQPPDPTGGAPAPDPTGERGEETCLRASDCGPAAKAPDEPPSPTGYAPPLDSTRMLSVPWTRPGGSRADCRRKVDRAARPPYRNSSSGGGDALVRLLGRAAQRRRPHRTSRPQGRLREDALAAGAPRRVFPPRAPDAPTGPRAAGRAARAAEPDRAPRARLREARARTTTASSR